ncbi:GH32 C-terminal domain-containing protein [Corynebacterium suedekumii]|uniref:beta-fructofuranosidase n=1 Tax=Corynebacterium suedekumii TaxID=3049801 RepID=A0ABY8VJA5_9CORY|nr:GH32 C-terminal domain-containing protein [Corynebacterium suedekumii]WIM69432.1 GH32 C-terminal domain-containing protein [Corynebacterium suedekumii]
MSYSSHRPELHVTAESGILDAPAGVLLDGDTWHLFHQYRPTPDSPARWAHVVSEDGPFDWEVCDDAIAPVGGETGLRAGAVVASADGLGADLYFTSVTAAGTSIQLAKLSELEDLCPVSDDEFAVDTRVRRIGDVVGDLEGHIRFRSPCVVPDWESEDNREAGHDGWLMLAVTGRSGDPTPVVLTSPDGITWELVGPMTFTGEPGFDAGSVLVGPRILRLRDEVDGEIYDVLMVTIEQDGLDISGYLVGTLTGAEFEVRTSFTHVDHGHDFTRPRNTNVTADTVPAEERYHRSVLFGLLNGVGRKDVDDRHLSLAQEGWANVISLPRVITLQGGVLFQTPPAGLPEAITRTHAARSWTGLCEVPAGSELVAEVVDAAGATAARITHSGDQLRIDRSMNPHHAGDAEAVADLAEGDTDSLSIFVDGSTVEIFADGGAVAMASRVYIDGGCSGISVTTTGDAEILRAWDRAPVSSGNLPDYGEPSPDE